jgi:hypothetical protein
MALSGTAGAAIEAGAALLLLLLLLLFLLVMLLLLAVLLLAKSNHKRHNRRRISKDKQDRTLGTTFRQKVQSSYFSRISGLVLIACRKRNILTHPIVTLVFARVPCAVRDADVSTLVWPGRSPTMKVLSSDR